ncbi:hypothetical protein [Nocardia australiensis]|uniref:hypothetical protein n=1 Tax=Nocardia australiensis TaxID=2887191 RepID=UPI001D137554|nr:hypothetical protein [Nocardia australiensis]
MPEPPPNLDEPPNSAQPSGDWKQWLDAPSPAPDLPTPAAAEDHYPSDDRLPEFDAYDESGQPAPELIDRSGGNAVSRLRQPPRQRDQPLRNRTRANQSGQGNRLVAVLIVFGIAVAIGAVILVAVRTTGKHATPAADSPPTLVQVAGPATSSTSSSTASPSSSAPAIDVPGNEFSAVATLDCEQSRTSDVVSGTDPGGTTDGPSAILAFERAYYVQRSGFAARAVVADDAAVPAAEQIQRGIDQIPEGTLYCVRITRTAVGGGDGQGHWEVGLTQQSPGREPQTFTQLITTRTTAVRTLITAITAG